MGSGRGVNAITEGVTCSTGGSVFAIRCHKQELALLTRAQDAFTGSAIPRRDRVLDIASSIWLFPSLLKYRSVLTVAPNVQMWSATSTSRHGNLFKCFVSANAVPQICWYPGCLRSLEETNTSQLEGMRPATGQ